MLFAKDLTELCVLYAVTPLHAGSGQAISAVDLPIQRERHTQWPHVQSSGMKGAFRDWFYRYYEANPTERCGDSKDQAEELAKKIFGREEGSAGNEETKGGHAGAISITDARLLAFPVRSNVSPFVWVTCPAVLSRLKKDLALCPIGLTVPDIDIQGDDAFVINGDIKEKGIVLEDMAVSCKDSPQNISQLTAFFTRTAPQVQKLLLISDSNYSFLVQTATEVQPQIKIEPDTGTTKDGSLRYQELLPSDSLLYCLLFFSAQRITENPMGAEMIRDCVKAAISSHIQIGGDMTLGRGLMEINWIAKKQ